MISLRALAALVLLPIAISAVPQGQVSQAVAAPTPPTTVGVNLGSLQYWARERVFANLAQGGWTFQKRPGGWFENAELINPDKTLKPLPPGVIANKVLVQPAGSFEKIDVVCTFDGTATFKAWGTLTMKSSKRNRFTISMARAPSKDVLGVLTVETMSAEDPLRNFDCREAGLPRSTYFAPEFVEYMRNFTGVRFLGWQMTGQLRTWKPDWDAMMKQDPGNPAGSQGVSIDVMVALANEADVDPWFMMPFNADEQYIRNFAKYVHQNLEPGRVAYVELDNEVWNFISDITQQAMSEGYAAKLSDDSTVALMRRYAQKSKQALKIWSEVFADNPKRLVRVVSTQAVCTDCLNRILSFEDTAKFVDAAAIAPYFGYDLKEDKMPPVDGIFDYFRRDVDRAIDVAVAQKAIADRYGKRLIAYEAGQHFVTKNQQLAEIVQRDPRMGEVYTRYLNGWKERVGDRIMMFSATSPVGTHGSWGLREYAGQPESEAPKLAATKAFIETLRR